MCVGKSFWALIYNVYQTCGKLPFEGDTGALENVCRSTTMLVFVLAGE